METVFLESIQKENTSLFTPIDCFPVNKVKNRSVFVELLCCSDFMLSSMIPPGKDQDTMMGNVRHIQCFQVCSFVFTAYKAFWGMDTARKAASLDTDIPSPASLRCVSFVSSVNSY